MEKSEAEMAILVERRQHTAISRKASYQNLVKMFNEVCTIKETLVIPRDFLKKAWIIKAKIHIKTRPVNIPTNGIRLLKRYGV